MKKVNKLIKIILGSRELSLIIVLILGSIIMGISSQHFLKFANLTSILLGLTVEGVMVIGMSLLLISGGLDLSIVQP